MEFLLTAVLVAVAAASSIDDQNLILDAENEGKVFILARRINAQKKRSSIKVKFAILGYSEGLDTDKASFGRFDEKFVDDDLKATYNIYSKEEIEKFFEDKKRKPKRMPDSAIIGVADNGEATCDQHARYGISYDDKDRAVIVRVLGCCKSSRFVPEDLLKARSDINIRVRRFIPFRQQTPVEVKFAIVSFGVDLYVTKVSFGRLDKKLVENDLQIELKYLNQEDINKIAEEKGNDKKKLPQNVILGKANNSAATCNQNAKCALSYGGNTRLVRVVVLGRRH